MITVILFLSLFGIFYAYFGYPIALMLASGSKNSTVVSESRSEPTSVGIIITVRNEQVVIKDKIEKTLALKYAGKSIREHLASGSTLVQLIVASDSSDDSTDDIVRGFSGSGVQLVSLDERGGKEKAQKAAIAQVDAEIIVFTDAKIILNEDAIDNFVTRFEDKTVGAVSSTDRIISNNGKSSGEGFYVRYEMWLRALESDFNSLVGLSGSCFAVRRQVAVQLDTSIPSDFALLIESCRQGLRGVHEPGVIGSYKAVKTEKEEFARKVRTVLRGITAFMSRIEVINPFRYGLFSWQIISHKLFRWMVPWLLVISWLCLLILAPGSLFYAVLFLLMNLFFALAVFASLFSPLSRVVLFKIPLFFAVVNLAIAVAWVKYLGGTRSVAWDPSKKAS